MSYARRMWPAFETYHAHIYFVPEAAEAYRRLGLKGGWMGYFASRSAPLGAASPELVSAVFFNFHPAMVARALPDAWALASPEDVLAARLQTADVALRRLIPDHVGSPAEAEAAALAREAVEAPALSGRPLFAALRSLPWPDQPHLVLWHACTLLREHRGDGHVASLTAAGLDGCEAHVTRNGHRGRPPGDAAVEPQVERRRVGGGRGTPAGQRLARRRRQPHRPGRAGRAEVEARTDELAEEPWRALGAERTERLLELLTPMARAINDAGGVPVPNPVGVPAP